MKYIVYKYNDARSDELEFDGGGIHTFTVDDIVFRQGTSWKIQVVMQQDDDDHKTIPTLWVYLSRMIVN